MMPQTPRQAPGPLCEHPGHAKHGYGEVRARTFAATQRDRHGRDTGSAVLVGLLMCDGCACDRSGPDFRLLNRADRRRLLRGKR